MTDGSEACATAEPSEAIMVHYIDDGVYRQILGPNNKRSIFYNRRGMVQPYDRFTAGSQHERPGLFPEGFKIQPFANNLSFNVDVLHLSFPNRRPRARKACEILQTSHMRGHPNGYIVKGLVSCLSFRCQTYHDRRGHMHRET